MGRRRKDYRGATQVDADVEDMRQDAIAATETRGRHQCLGLPPWPHVTGHQVAALMDGRWGRKQSLRRRKKGRL